MRTRYFRPDVRVAYSEDGEVSAVHVDWDGSLDGADPDDEVADEAARSALDRWLLDRRLAGDLPGDVAAAAVALDPAGVVAALRDAGHALLVLSADDLRTAVEQDAEDDDPRWADLDRDELVGAATASRPWRDGMRNDVLLEDAAAVLEWALEAGAAQLRGGR